MMEFHLDDLLGELIRLDEIDYASACGTLELRVLRVRLVRSDPGWASVVGAYVDLRGVELGLREVSVRVEALAAHLRARRAAPRMRASQAPATSPGAG